ncbi:SDR family NAD(P)-dependent oxidoreductase [Gordonia sp. C13]|uniref:SDR family NAD(P)-dependent oxidoreductase n=1 Tax=Gordonia sp. C13 TaxID=2935078 RepID=UPI00200B307B|nr:SDR family NAD(P)-dependent oxidoreductase [Gordonia sp. C13]MCK8615958.1 SDR family oxidoreductase [Gordonia sp. C13]
MTTPVALVAGATGPLGRAVVKVLSDNGMHVGALSRSGDLPSGAEWAAACDITDAAAVDVAITDLEAGLGPVEVLINAAHPPAHGETRIAELAADELATQFGAVTGHIALCARVIPGMRSAGRGRIVYLAGALMARPIPGHGAYGAAKAAAATLTRFLAAEEGRAGITANIVAPGRVVDPADPIDTDPGWVAAADDLVTRMSLSDFPTPHDVATTVLSLVTNAAVTAQTIWVTGGEPIA